MRILWIAIVSLMSLASMSACNQVQRNKDLPSDNATHSLTLSIVLDPGANDHLRVFITPTSIRFIKGGNGTVQTIAVNKRDDRPDARTVNLSENGASQRQADFQFGSPISSSAYDFNVYPEGTYGITLLPGGDDPGRIGKDPGDLYAFELQWPNNPSMDARKPTYRVTWKTR